MADEFDVGDDTLSGDPTVTDTEYVEDGMVTTLSDGTLIGSYDTNDDQIVDIALIDEGGDGTLDMIVDDADYDGAADTLYVAGATISVDEATGEVTGVTETGTTEPVYDPSTTPLDSGNVTQAPGGVTAPVETEEVVAVSGAEATVVDTEYFEDSVVTTLSDGTVIADYDTNDDGYTDIEIIDEQGDGTVDAILDDADYDGAIDTVYVAGATMTVDESTGELIDVNETNTTEAVYDPSTVPVDAGMGPDRFEA